MVLAPYGPSLATTKPRSSASPQYGPETQEIRGLVKQSYGTWIQTLVSRDPAEVAALGNVQALRGMEGLQHKLKELSPRNAEQRELQTNAIQIAPILKRRAATRKRVAQF